MAKLPDYIAIKVDTTEAHRELDALVARIDRIEARLAAMDAELRPKTITMEVGQGLFGNADDIVRAIQANTKMPEDTE